MMDKSLPGQFELYICSDGFSRSVLGMCSRNIGEQVLFPYVPVPVPCSRIPPSPQFPFFDCVFYFVLLN